MQYALALWLALGSLQPFVEAYFGMQTYFSTGTSNSVFKFLGYFVLGALLRDLKGARGMLPFSLLFAPAFGIPAFSLGIFLAALLLVFIVKRLPGIRHIVP